MKKERLDQRLLALNLADCAKTATALILAGRVWVDEQRIDKAGHPVKADAVIRVDQGNKYVSRGGEKLAGLFDTFKQLSADGRVAMDIGVSTGGFTDCLLQHGARHVIGVDVSYGITAMALQKDPRVTLIERCNARHLERDTVEKALIKNLGDDDARGYIDEISLVSMDVSFISIRKVLPAILTLSQPGSDYLCLFKPQFEAKREDVPSGGIIQDQDLVNDILARVKDRCEELGLEMLECIPSPIKGSKGNQEYLLWMRQ